MCGDPADDDDYYYYEDDVNNNPGCSGCYHCQHNQSVFLPRYYGSNEGFCIYDRNKVPMSIVNYAAAGLTAFMFTSLIVVKLFPSKLQRVCIRRTSSVIRTDEADVSSEIVNATENNGPLLEDYNRETGTLGSDSDSNLGMPKLEKESFNDCIIGGSSNRETAVRDLRRMSYWPWELVTCWSVYGSLDMLLFFACMGYMGIISAFAFADHGYTWGDYHTSFPLFLILLGFCGFRMGYVVSKYFSLALEIFHKFSFDNLLLGVTVNSLGVCNNGSTSCTLSTRVDGAEKAAQSDRSPPDHISSCELGHVHAPTSTCKVHRTTWKTFLNTMKTFFTYAPEFIQALQICSPLLTPYIVYHVNNGYQVLGHSGFLAFKIPNLDVFGDKSDIKFVFFLTCGITVTVSLFVAMVLPVCVGEPWAMTILKLSRQAVTIANYEARKHRVCDIRCHCYCCCCRCRCCDCCCCCGSCPCVSRAWMKLLDMLIRVVKRNERETGRPWVKHLFFTIKKCADLSFIPIIIHLAGLFINSSLYPGLYMSAAWYIGTMVTIICLYLLYTLVYSFSAALISIHDQAAKYSSTRSKPTDDKTQLFIHPRFLYKMIWARLAVIVLSAESRSHTSSIYAILAPSNLHVRIFLVTILWWVVLAHAELLKSTWQWCKRQWQKGTPYHAYRSHHSSLTYPTNVKWFNVRHRAAWTFVALVSTLILVEYFVWLSPAALVIWISFLFTLVLTVTEYSIMYFKL